MTVLRTDPRVVARLAKEFEDENWEFRSFLKNLDMEAAELDAIVHRIHDDVADAIDCTLCAVCPIVFNVYERLKDELWR